MLDDEDEDNEVEVQSVPASFLFRLLHDARAARRPLRKMPSFTKPHKEPQEAGVGFSSSAQVNVRVFFSFLFAL